MQLKTKGLVLREVKTGEADRILTILTPEHGILSASAKSSLRLKNKLFAATGLFCYSEFVLFPGKNMYIVDEATPIEVFFELRQSVEGMALAMYFAELAATVAQEGEEAESLLRLLLNSFFLIGTQKKPLHQIKAVFEFRTLFDAGFMPDIVGCCECGSAETETFRFDLSEGALFCQNCAEKIGAAPNISRSQLAAMQHMLYSEPEKAYSFTLLPEAMAGLSRLATHYVCSQLDHRFKTLDFLETVLD